jgi:hypothetical protein
MLINWKAFSMQCLPSIPSLVLSIPFEDGLSSVEAIEGPANGGPAVMAVSVTLQMECDGVTVTILEAVLLNCLTFLSRLCMRLQIYDIHGFSV